jgi:hypothetical protein
MPDFQTTIWNTERVYMVDFGRAKTGAAHRRFPDVDDVGYHDNAFAAEHGPIVSAMATQTRVTVRFRRTEISTGATLFAVSSNPAAVNVTSPAGGALSGSRVQDIEFTAGAAAGRAAIEIRYKWNDGPVIGRLYVQVYARIQVLMRVHLVTYVQRDAAGNIVAQQGHPNPFFSKNCTNRAQRVARIQEFINRANETWIPHGIVFTVVDIVDTVWGRPEFGTATISPNFAEMTQAGALSPGRSAVSVNVYCIPSTTQGITGMGIPPAWARSQGLLFPPAPPPPAAPPPQHLSSALYLVSGSTATAQTVAHEMGHYMTLCALNPVTGNADQWHSTGDVLGGAHTRDDSVSRRRIMYPVVSLLGGAPSNWRDDTGYGNLLKGSFITYRRLPAGQDITFEESQRARTAAVAPGFYAA